MSEFALQIWFWVAGGLAAWLFAALVSGLLSHNRSDEFNDDLQTRYLQTKAALDWANEEIGRLKRHMVADSEELDDALEAAGIRMNPDGYRRSHVEAIEVLATERDLLLTACTNSEAST